MFVYLQCLTVNAGASGEVDKNESDSLFESTIEGSVLEGIAYKPQTVKVSSEVSSNIYCYISRVLTAVIDLLLGRR
jgi:hypothetical protein